MSNSSKIIIAILDFIICAVIGYMGMKFLSRTKENVKGGMAQTSSAGVGISAPQGTSKTAPFPETSNSRSVTQPSASGSVKAQALDSSQPMPAGAASMGNADLRTGLVAMPEILSVTSPSYDDMTKTYSFQVVASGERLTYTVADAKRKDIMSNSTGDFSVQPSSTGKYYVYIVDGYGNKSDYAEVRGCFRLVNRITKEELEEVFNSKSATQDAIDADFPNRVASGCKYDFVDLKEDEVPPGSYNEIINRIRMKTWSSVTILSVTHARENNKLVRAKVRVNY